MPTDTDTEIEDRIASVERRIASMTEAWKRLVHVSRHQTRYFFHSMIIGEAKNHTPLNFLKIVRSLVASNRIREKLLRSLESGFVLYRARHYDGTWSVNDPAQLRAPPPELARAGRMNPAGISYLYLATDEKTALSEIRPKAGSTAVVAEFSLTKDLCLLDLTDLSIGADDAEDIKLVMQFLKEFSQSINKPVDMDGAEHIDYVPSQIVCEYFAQAHLMGGQKNPDAQEETWDRINGIIYGSTIRAAGVNVVLFPRFIPTKMGLSNGSSKQSAHWNLRILIHGRCRSPASGITSEIATETISFNANQQQHRNPAMDISAILAITAIAGIAYVFGAFTETVAEEKGYDARNWFWGGFCFWFIALIAAAGLPAKAGFPMPNKE